MSWILQIDTALDTATISLSKDGKLTCEKINGFRNDHASFLHIAVASILKEAGISLAELNAVAVIAGPGSYTGLRVGLAAAKGLCYALNIPLITIGTLDYMAASALLHLKETDKTGTMLVCPMIDARRMEVYTALYNSQMELKLSPQALILDDGFLFDWLLNNQVYFFGTGYKKWQAICNRENARFCEINNNSKVLSTLTVRKFQDGDFASVAYYEPVYIKEFYIEKA